MPKRVALFGGTFDPIHRAHLIVAREAADEFELDEVWFIPAAHPPHKNDTQTTYEHRFHMVAFACAEDSRFVASRLEEGAERSYSFHTIQRAKALLQPEDELFFLIGADAFAEIGSWYRSQDVLNMVSFIVVTRPGHSYDTPAGATVLRLESLALLVSSSEVRAKLAAGQEAKELPIQVRNYIREHSLYSDVQQFASGR